MVGFLPQPGERCPGEVGVLLVAAAELDVVVGAPGPDEVSVPGLQLPERH